MRLTVHVKPNARTTAVGGISAGSLAVRVKERAIDGAANEAVIVAVAAAFDLRPRQVRLVLGRTSRRKLLDLDLSDALGAARLAELQGATGPLIPPSRKRDW